MQTPALIVSIHDVSPLTRDLCDQILADLAEAGASPVSLLVIPNHHRKAPIRGDAAFRAWIGGRQAEGHEIVAHGYFHERPAQSNDGPLARVINRFYTAGEGEFFDLPEDRARDLLRQGKEDLAWCGASPSGFIAPAWLLGREAARAAWAEGFAYTTRLDRIEPSSGPSHRTQSLVWSVRAAWRRATSLVWNRLLAASLAGNPAVRLGIHPPDWKHPAIRKQILSLARAALAARRPMTYHRWVSSQRT